MHFARMLIFTHRRLVGSCGSGTRTPARRSIGGGAKRPRRRAGKCLDQVLDEARVVETLLSILDSDQILNGAHILSILSTSVSDYRAYIRR